MYLFLLRDGRNSPTFKRDPSTNLYILGTVISIRPNPDLNFTAPIAARLRQRDSLLRTSADPSMLIQGLLDLSQLNSYLSALHLSKCKFDSRRSGLGSCRRIPWSNSQTGAGHPNQTRDENRPPPCVRPLLPPFLTHSSLPVHILSGDLILHKRTLEPIKTVIYGLRRYDVDRCAALIDTSNAQPGTKVEGFMTHKAKIYLVSLVLHAMRPSC
jgi:hypothetical protein